jgi:hypothetical protein
VSWYLIERACFSLTSALSRSPTMRWGSCWPSVPGSRLNADHPENGVLIPCRNTVCEAVLDCGCAAPALIYSGEILYEIDERRQISQWISILLSGKQDAVSTRHHKRDWVR